ncbi:DNA topoisomerase [Bacteroides thetaiotaomicron]|nr:DNA topoisomerase [Bacteroides thetaiotaomicron]
MNKEEQLVYTLILGRTLEAFMPSCRVEYTTIDVVCAARKFSVQTYRVLKKGWLSIFGREHLIARGVCPVPHYRISPRESRYR